MSMVEHFFSIKHKGRGNLFEDLSVWQEEKYRSLQGTYPVISLSFAEIKSRSYEQARKEMISLIVELYEKYIYLMEGDFLMETEKEYYKMVNLKMEDAIAVRAIGRMCSFFKPLLWQECHCIIGRIRYPHAGSLCTWLLGRDCFLYEKSFKFNF